MNGLPEGALAALFRENGEGRLSGRIARAIVRARPLTTTGQLADVVSAAVPAAVRRKGHPARRVFQALRIEVNDELGQLRAALPAALSHLAVGGVCAVISYHSGEDRLTKQTFAERGVRRVRLPAGPAVCVRCRRPSPPRLPWRPQAVGVGGRREPTGRERSSACHRANGRGLMAPPSAATAAPARRHCRCRPEPARRVAGAVVRRCGTGDTPGAAPGHPGPRPGREHEPRRVASGRRAEHPVRLDRGGGAPGGGRGPGAPRERPGAGCPPFSTTSTLEQAAHRQAELAVAQLETPSRIVAAATGEGMVRPAGVVELPYVSLSVPLPTPKVTPRTDTASGTDIGTGRTDIDLGDGNIGLRRCIHGRHGASGRIGVTRRFDDDGNLDAMSGTTRHEPRRARALTRSRSTSVDGETSAPNGRHRRGRRSPRRRRVRVRRRPGSGRHGPGAPGAPGPPGRTPARHQRPAAPAAPIGRFPRPAPRTTAPARPHRPPTQGGAAVEVAAAGVLGRRQVPPAGPARPVPPRRRHAAPGGAVGRRPGPPRRRLRGGGTGGVLHLRLVAVGAGRDLRP